MHTSVSLLTHCTVTEMSALVAGQHSHSWTESFNPAEWGTWARGAYRAESLPSSSRDQAEMSGAQLAGPVSSREESVSLISATRSSSPAAADAAFSGVSPS